ncbi:MAG: hypothetical protein LUF02_01510 [Erysipelotrichaceae bacterium]|nr:hypothetical protein [Erysipelotrichaceae bacterium]
MIKWGIIGYGRIASRFEKSLSYSHNGELYAIGTRSKCDEAKHSHPNIKISRL